MAGSDEHLLCCGWSRFLVEQDYVRISAGRCRRVCGGGRGCGCCCRYRCRSRCYWCCRYCCCDRCCSGGCCCCGLLTACMSACAVASLMGDAQVPSDITLLEEQQTVGRRRLRLLERLGLLTMPHVFHIGNYSKADKHDLQQVLQRQYSLVNADPATDIVRRRQESIRRRVVAHNGVWAGTLLGGVAGHYLLRHYDWKTKAIVLPFLLYGGSWIGRWTADGLAGRWSEWGRDRALGELPPKVFFSP